MSDLVHIEELASVWTEEHAPWGITPAVAPNGVDVEFRGGIVIENEVFYLFVIGPDIRLVDVDDFEAGYALESIFPHETVVAAYGRWPKNSAEARLVIEDFFASVRRLHRDGVASVDARDVTPATIEEWRAEKLRRVFSDGCVVDADGVALSISRDERHERMRALKAAASRAA